MAAGRKRAPGHGTTLGLSQVPGVVRLFLTHLECPRCGATLPVELANLCACGSPLLARYDLERVGAALTKADLAGRAPTLWRYAEFLPLRDPARAVSLGEGFTPILPTPRLGRQIGLPNLFLKDEGVNPTGTFKARGAAVGVSMARELGVKTFALPTAGNAGGAWACYGARAGLGAVVCMPQDAPAINRKETAAAGARTYLVRGLISDAGRIVARGVARFGWFDASTLKEPYRIEGKKTMGLEIAEQFAWRLPDAILYPTGGGVGIIGIYKALLELEAIGWVQRPFPKLISVQAAGCQPIVRAFEAGASASQFFEGASTLASGLRVPKALGDFLVLEAVRATGGTAVAVEDEATVAAMRRAAAAEGLFICPEGAAAVAAAERLRASGWLAEGERVVILNTGTGLKYPESVEFDLPVLDPDDDIPE